jgi:hypothetical protein
MKYVKMLGLLAVAAAALMAFAGSASATTVTSPEGTLYTGKITAVSHNGHVRLVGPLGIDVQCASHVEGTVESHGAGVTAKGSIGNLSFTACTNGYTVTVLSKGSLEVHKVTGTNTGTLTSTGTEVTVHTPLGFSCIYKTNSTHIGTLTDSKATGGHATLDINAVSIPRTGDSSLCGATGQWSGSYTVTTPSTLILD